MRGFSLLAWFSLAIGHVNGSVRRRQEPVGEAEEDIKKFIIETKPVGYPSAPNLYLAPPNQKDKLGCTSQRAEPEA